MQARVFAIICSILIVSIMVSAVYLLGQESFATLSVIEQDSDYRLLDTELVPREEMTSFVIAEDKVYTYYDRSGLVNVYFLDGSFCYGIQVPTLKSGKGDIALHEGLLIINSRRSFVYFFDEGELVDLFQPIDKPDRYLALRELFSQEKNHEDGANVYQLSPSSNDIVSTDNTSVLIDLPEKSKLADNLLIAGMLLLGLSITFYKELKKKDIFQN